MVMYGNASCILYFKQIINTHIKNYVLAHPQPSPLPATATTSLNQQTRPGKS